AGRQVGCRSRSFGRTPGHDAADGEQDEPERRTQKHRHHDTGPPELRLASLAALSFRKVTRYMPKCSSRPSITSPHEMYGNSQPGLRTTCRTVPLACRVQSAWKNVSPW